jgi:hypothetical protein
LGASAPALTALLLLLVAAASWAFPVTSGLLSFSQAETQLLFPAPVSRRQLLLYRLLRSQVAVLFSACVMALLYPGGSMAGRLRSVVAIWIFLMTCHLYFAGVTRARRRQPSQTTWTGWLAHAPLVVTLAATAIVGTAVVQTIVDSPIVNIRDALVTLSGIAQAGLPQIALLPFAAILRPLFAGSTTAWVWSLPAAAATLAATAVWVLKAGEAFDPNAEAVPEQRGARSTRRTAAYHARTTGWVLGLTGRPETAFVWKGAAQTFRAVDWRVLLRFVVIVLWLVLAAFAVSRARGLTQLLGVVSAIAMTFTVVMAPQILRVDLRQDLQHLELLKTWPVRPAAIVRGELMWPAMVVTVLAWALGALALSFSAAAFASVETAWRLAAGTAVMILTPAIVCAQYIIHNAAALMFPAWIQLGSGRARGVDAMGQRLILLSGTWLMLAVFLLPGVILGGILCLVFYRFAGPWTLVPGAVVCLAVVGIELLLATEALGPLYERLDLTSVERPE